MYQKWDFLTTGKPNQPGKTGFDENKKAPNESVL
jgi:hypothetical protein